MIYMDGEGELFLIRKQVDQRVEVQACNEKGEPVEATTFWTRIGRLFPYKSLETSA